MEFNFKIGSILKGESSICVVRNNLQPVNLDDFQNIKTCKEENHNNDVRRSCCLNPITHSLFGSLTVKNGCGVEKNDCDLLCTVIDEVGEASAKAQSLNVPITTAHKLKISDHVLFIMKDLESYDGKGCVVGILKVGRKKLFIVDEMGKFHEVNPLCILDFYVHESRQRMGCGKQLFEAFLKAENISPQELAIDRPSAKFLGFLKKHYNLEKTIPQTNRFVVFSGFFDKISSETLEALPRTNQRHSFAGVEYRCKNQNGRPHSLGGIEGCFSQTKEDDKGDCGGSSKDFRTAKKMAYESQKRNSSSWNVFGVPSHDYSQEQDKS